MKARTAADAGDYTAWSEVNERYIKALANLQLVCENNIRDLTTKPVDIADRGFKQVFDALRPYLDGVGPLLKARLHLVAYTNLLQRAAPTERRVALEALVPLYFTGE